MQDLISRQAAIDAILHITNCKSVRELFEYNQAHHLTEMWSGGVNDAIDAVIGVESATDKNVGSSDDCISRQAVIDALHTWFRDGFEEDKWWNSTHVLAAIEGLPPVTSKQRTGHWIPVGVAEVVGGESAQWGSAVAYHKCSECDGQALRDDFEQEVLSDFCPHCGAKMISEDKTCDCYRDGTCIGTKEIDSCSCGGVKSKCDFYEHVRWEGEAE